ncbi:DinB family protein [Deinococcus sp.]|uniref:DinB family protein n=1 Tax=Deinococcus sp. TaxID=47478 RepID=UPI003CC63D41
MSEGAQPSAFSLHKELGSVEDSVAEYFGALPEAVFFGGTAESWSPAHHLEHLNISHRTLGKALRLPKAALLAVGGRTDRASRGYDLMRETYRAALSAGGKASGRYLPVLGEASQAQLVSEFRQASQELRQAVSEWPEADLNTYLLPHPILGKLTVREMLYFAAYHQQHHLDGVRRSQRRKESETE